ncbi:rhodanese-like domain-containing protein [Paenibacillus sp. TRM 82003]|uniref:rhodanese-like domain-containing protein n=1 Tax=Kineococcus sp. TRM81007 TaxID=2925831 RepID=UPI001F57AB8C|nr:rhodanese-like domain-containing protein [Kineococcus sp. TRM81007]MCI2236915.1 rhodanese-like domain-containing protein [Kineococcus sp. TRM81007]MCI3921907.1 rhodanese-like domain-containing protein [Paenibacillus sp. TRM 82003]
MSEVPSVTAADVPADATILDVREDDEWVAGHADGALHIPMGEVPQRLGELPEGELHVVCRAGGRSLRVAQWLSQNGYEVVNVDGGMGAWADAGRPMVSESGGEPFVR